MIANVLANAKGPSLPQEWFRRILDPLKVLAGLARVESVRVDTPRSAAAPATSRRSFSVAARSHGRGQPTRWATPQRLTPP